MTTELGLETVRNPFYGSRPLKRQRRTKAQLEQLKSTLYDLVEANRPATCRQIFYLSVSAGLLPKTEREYKNVLRYLTQMRDAEDLPWWWIADTTRDTVGPNLYGSPAEFIERVHHAYRRDMWAHTDCHVEIWTEKETLSGPLAKTTFPLGISLFPCRGYPSTTFLRQAAQDIANADVPTFIYYLGDRDPSGSDIARLVHERLELYAPDADIRFEQLAVTLDQVREMELEGRPTKQTDSRAANFEGDSYEVESIPPDELRRLVEKAIMQHVDKHELKAIKAAEADERIQIKDLVQHLES